MEDIFEMSLFIIVNTAYTILILIALFTSPLWIIPYILYRKHN